MVREYFENNYRPVLEKTTFIFMHYWTVQNLKEIHNIPIAYFFAVGSDVYWMTNQSK